MLTHRLVQALLLAVTATVALPGSVSFVQAAEECRSKPGPTASSGSRWLYQINRTDHRHCWFLSSKAVSTQSQSSRRYRHLAGESDAVRQDQQGGSDLKARSAPASETDVAEAAEPPTAPQIAAPSVGLWSENLVAHSVPTVVYKLPPPCRQDLDLRIDHRRVSKVWLRGTYFGGGVLCVLRLSPRMRLTQTSRAI